MTSHGPTRNSHRQTCTTSDSPSDIASMRASISGSRTRGALVSVGQATVQKTGPVTGAACQGCLCGPSAFRVGVHHPRPYRCTRSSAHAALSERQCKWHCVELCRIMSPHPYARVHRAHSQTSMRTDTRHTIVSMRAKTTGLLAIEAPVSAVSYRGVVHAYLGPCRRPITQLRREIRIPRACSGYG